MSVFVPFRAYRPATQELLKAVTSKPYDVLNAQEAREIAEGNDISFYRVIKPEIDFEPGQDPFVSEVYERGKDNLERLIEKQILVQDSKASYYVYRIQMGEHIQTGLVGCCSIEDYFDGIIKKHELTNPKVEASRMKHITTSEYTYEPVFFSYERNESLHHIVELVTSSEPLYGFTSTDGNLHTIWAIDEDVMIARITELFENEVSRIYIADGHHRTAAGALAGRELQKKNNNFSDHHYNDLMCVLFPHDQVSIMDYNRVIRDLNGHSAESFLAEVKRRFNVTMHDQPYKPLNHDQIGMYIGGQWYQLTAKKESFDAQDLIDHLGFTILSKQILEPILNIVDLRRDERIAFVGGIRGLGELEKRVDSGEMKVAFAMCPISMKELMNIADLDLLLPPKVTWFEPKLRSGIFVHRLKGEKHYDLADY